jgi:hypothetical protein
MFNVRLKQATHAVSLSHTHHKEYTCHFDNWVSRKLSLNLDRGMFLPLFIAYAPTR